MKTYKEPIDQNAEKQETEKEKQIAIDKLDAEKPPLVDRSKAFYSSFIFVIIFLVALILAIVL